MNKELVAALSGALVGGVISTAAAIYATQSEIESQKDILRMQLTESSKLLKTEINANRLNIEAQIGATNNLLSRQMRLNVYSGIIQNYGDASQVWGANRGNSRQWWLLNGHIGLAQLVGTKDVVDKLVKFYGDSNPEKFTTSNDFKDVYYPALREVMKAMENAAGDSK